MRRNCIATIYVPHDEDFVISPVESMASGKPVVGVAEGGLLESVVHGETGLLIDPDKLGLDATATNHEGVRAVIEAINTLDAAAALDLRSACEERAALFGNEVFDEKFKALIDK